MDLLRRRCVEKLCTAELFIRQAILEVEKLGADPVLTKAVTNLSKAFDNVADYVDRE